MFIMWIIAGFIIGYIGPQVVLLCFRVHTPLLFHITLGFVGALTAYTIMT
jgi:uncharacterized membrane protein YeaQ/YmgE (transglycosylase-associated protein family)